ncbi:ABC transporter ATP-binding protein [Ensifer soli]|uniref:ABC transporter ATP-binding protein n=1 Tax=Ciceribacter sp. sgz301302 TaxID=3342379 RepID=UPI0035B90758
MTSGAGVEDKSGLALEIVGATRAYGPVRALDAVTVSARKGEFLTILGQSGSGKTTLLRLIAGLDHPSAIERLAIGGADVLGLPPHKRNVATVFQHYALFPHMTVGENVAYPLKLRGVDPAGRVRQALAMLDTVRLGDKADRRIHQLSGGERQRVALARAIICKPEILLLDEPLGALDERLRLDMQIELLQLQRHFGMTFVYITHSQEEALTMSDRVVLMRRGRIEQEGKPSDLFERPVSDFVGNFMGVENILRGRIEAVSGDRVTVGTASGGFTGQWTGRAPPRPGEPAALMVRAEKVRIAATGLVSGTLAASVYKGRSTEHVVETAGGRIHALTFDGASRAPGPVSLAWDEADARIAPVAA